MADIIYKGERLFLCAKIETEDRSFHNADSLWVITPEQRALPGMKFHGGYPDEWCIDLSDIAEDNEYKVIKERDGFPIGFIIKENGTYKGYFSPDINFPCKGRTLDDAVYWFMITTLYTYKMTEQERLLAENIAAYANENMKTRGKYGWVPKSLSYSARNPFYQVDYGTHKEWFASGYCGCGYVMVREDNVYYIVTCDSGHFTVHMESIKKDGEKNE